MKNRIILAVVVFSVSICSIILFAGSEAAQSKQVKTEINKMSGQYGDKLIEAFYSIDELRPLAIIKLGKTSQMYKNEWIPPLKLVSALTKEEKDELKTKLTDQIAGMNADRRSLIIAKLHGWIAGSLQISLLKEEMMISDNDLLTAIFLNNKTAFLLSDYSATGMISEVSELSSLQKNKAFYDALNVVSMLPRAEQLKYFSGVFGELYNLALK